jgi:hypothetical protein
VAKVLDRPLSKCGQAFLWDTVYVFGLTAHLGAIEFFGEVGLGLATEHKAKTEK